jgi:hypothetical protein
MKEALKLALEALKEAQTNDDGMEKWDRNKKAITAIKAALAQQADHSEQHLDMVKAQPAQQEPWCMKMNGCKTKCEDCPVEVVEQEPVNAWLIFGKDNEPLIVSSDWVITKKYKEAGRRVEQLAYYTTPPQLEERNFCPRCGKRTADLTVIHTCTPPQEKNT